MMNLRDGERGAKKSGGHEYFVSEVCFFEFKINGLYGELTMAVIGVAF